MSKSTAGAAAIHAVYNEIRQRYIVPQRPLSNIELKHRHILDQLDGIPREELLAAISYLLKIYEYRSFFREFEGSDSKARGKTTTSTRQAAPSPEAGDALAEPRPGTKRFDIIELLKKKKEVTANEITKHIFRLHGKKTAAATLKSKIGKVLGDVRDPYITKVSRGIYAYGLSGKAITR